MNVLFLVSSLTDACSFYLTGGIAKDLRQKKDDKIDVVEWQRMPLHWQNIMEYDLIMMQRPSNKADLDLAKYLKDMDTPLWIDFDDNLFDIPPENRAFLFYDEEKKGYVRDLLRIADYVTVTTDELKKVYSRYNQNIRVVPNAFNDSVFKKQGERTRNNKRDKLVLWRGSDTHIVDVWGFGEAIGRLVKEHEDYKFLFMGFNPWFLQSAPNLKAKRDSDLIFFHAEMLKERPYILHVPLIDNVFNRSKSNIAFIEGTYAGAACVVPDWWNVPALMYTDIDGYYAGIKALLKKEVDANKIVTQAWEYINDILSLSKINMLRLEILDECRK